MRRLGLALLVANLVTVSAALSQESDDPFTTGGRSSTAAVSTADVPPTSEMWFYEQERRRYENPRNAVRANAEVRAAQRQNRLAALRWFGFSNSRPRSGTDPVHGSYAPRWVSGGVVASEWRSSGQAVVVSPSAR